MTDESSKNKIRVLRQGEAVRRRPMMYFGDCYADGSLDVWPIEVACHAVDEIIDGNCTSLEISVHEAFFEVRYNAGISLDAKPLNNGLTDAEVILTQLHACHNLKKHLHVGEDMCHFGLAAINIAAAWCEVETVWNGQKGLFKFEQGVTIVKQIEAVTEADRTSIRLKPDKTLFPELWYSLDGVSERARELSSRLSGIEIKVLRG